MRQLPFFEDPETREDILEHISGYVFDRAMVRSDEPMRSGRYASMSDRWQEREQERKRSVRR